MALPFRTVSARPQCGFSLIEVLVALLLVALGVLGAAALQLNALRFTQDSAYRVQAGLLATDLLERMRANPSRIASYAGSVAGDCVAAPSDSLSVLAQDQADFAVAVTCHLPDGRAQVSVEDGRVRVQLNWSQARVDDSAEDELVVSVRLGRGA
ncbi:type IV pilus modification protein PilV [Halopseudomonas oceani]|uniref:Type IV pilus modification protein PilV n=1 Tax=Halopseudomonas oceani TaxID=1708783 RepID=A0A2P4ET52_9GAMM|nr:type IV pilus modification protein PilV [Halopseudomonas oceani]POB02452.1 type IV pilus modification protein PilV [Halopseudomonas oceani]GGE47969.1 type IV pilus modification protein PilV [Halopseudomonas oceani]